MGLGMQNTWLGLGNQVSGSQEDLGKNTEYHFNMQLNINTNFMSE
jgi:hypothetical protein